MIIVTDPSTVQGATLYELAEVIVHDLIEQTGSARTARTKIPAAWPYIEAMGSLENITDSYGYDSGRSVVAYFLNNAGPWKGATARAVKAELRRRLALS